MDPKPILIAFPWQKWSALSSTRLRSVVDALLDFEMEIGSPPW